MSKFGDWIIAYALTALIAAVNFLGSFMFLRISSANSLLPAETL